MNYNPTDVLDRETGEVVGLPALRPAQQDLALMRDPEQVLIEARRAAVALKHVIDNKERPVRINGETYLELEDWQTVGKFYGITARVASTQYVEFDGVKGFEARAEAIHVPTGQVVSAAESMCLCDEERWKNRPLFQVRSMSQTRACAKALRNVLAWVVVLGGYRATPAEEMDGVEPGHGGNRVYHAEASSASIGNGPFACAGCATKMTKGQAQFSQAKFGRLLCPKCQRNGNGTAAPAGQEPAPQAAGQAEIVMCAKCGKEPLLVDYVEACRETGAPMICRACCGGYEPGAEG